jgi:RNA polymerase sigma factor (sigma-70 family)
VREATAEEPSSNRSAAPITLSLDRIPEGTLKGACVTTEDSPLIHAMRTELKDARRRLSPAENRALSLLYDLGLKTKEAARNLGVDEHLVSQIKRRALAKLRTRFRRLNSRSCRAVSDMVVSEITTDKP